MPDRNLQTVTIYTDGACSGNPGPGGYGAILIHGAVRREMSKGYRRTTNNRMELLALIEAVRALRRPCHLEIHSDSQYVIGGFQKGWVANWKRNGWRTKNRQPVQNRDLWETLDQLLQPHEYRFHWVRGHSTNPENNRCDELAVTASKTRATLVDEGFEAENG